MIYHDFLRDVFIWDFLWVLKSNERDPPNYANVIALLPINLTSHQTVRNKKVFKRDTKKDTNLNSAFINKALNSDQF